MSQEKELTGSKATKTTEYTSDDLVHLSDCEHVRKRPGMYIGSTGRSGRHHLIDEVLTLMLGCFRAGLVSRISVVIHADNSITLCDDNTSCSLEVDKRFSKDQEREVTNLEREVSSLRNSSGQEFFGAKTVEDSSMFGVTITIVNFLSQWFHVHACGETDTYRQEYEHGQANSPINISPRTTESGTQFSFLPDPEIFQNDGLSFDYDFVKDRLEILAYLNAGLTTRLKDERTGEEAAFEFPKGIREYLQHIPKRQIDPWIHSGPIVIEAQNDDIDFQVAIQCVQPIVSFVNETACYEGGTHVTSFLNVMTDVLNEIARKEGHIDDDDPLPLPSDYESDLLGIIKVQMKAPQWYGSTKTKLGNSEMADFAEKQLRPKLVEFFESHKELAWRITRSAFGSAVSRVEV